MAEKEKQTEKDSDLFDELFRQIEEAEDNSSTHRDRYDDFYRLRVRHKKIKSFPFPGCSNLRLPTIETYMRKGKAMLVGLYANVKPRVMVIPQTDKDLNKARKIEKFLDWLADTKMDLFFKIVMLADRMLERGFAVAKIIWKMEDVAKTETFSLSDLSMEEANALFDTNTTDDQIMQFLVKKLNVDMSETVQTENIEALTKAIETIKKGGKSVKITLYDETYNAPDVVVVDPLFCGVPTDSGIDPQKLTMFYHEYYEPFESLKAKSKRGVLDENALDDIDYMKGMGTDNTKTVETTQDAREGIDRVNNPSHLVKLYDVYCYYDLDKDDILEKCHFIIAPEFRVVLKKQRLENDSQKFPIVRFNTEIMDDRWFSSRGYPEHLEDISKEIDAQHNQKIDSQTIRNAPMFTFRAGIVNPHLVRFIPGQGIPVPGMTPLDDAIKMLNNTNPNAEFSYEREELLLKTVAQEYLGQMDYSVQSMINKRQPRTLGEVQMQAQQANQVFSLDASLFTHSMSQMFAMILEFCQQYMPERIFTLITGENGVEPLHLTRDEIQGKYHIICRANDINSNPGLRAAKSLARVQLLLSPVPLQLGIVNPGNAFNVLKQYLQDDGVMGWQELISMPQPQPPQLPPAAAVIKPNFDKLTDAEQAQVLSSAGVRPDVQGRALKSSAIIEEKGREARGQEMENMEKFVDAMTTIGGAGGEEEKSSE